MSKLDYMGIIRSADKHFEIYNIKMSLNVILRVVFFDVVFDAAYVGQETPERDL